MLFPLSTKAAVPETEDPIVIVENNWTSQKVISRIVQRLLNRAGYRTSLLKIDTQSQFEAIGTGEAHLQMEIWQASMHSSFQEQIAAGRMIDAGSHSATTREDWWYPDYVEEICPELPDYRALNICAEKLATAETTPNAQYVSGPSEWHPEDLERIKSLGLNVTIVNKDSIESLFESLKYAAARKEPIVIFNWTPNWTGAIFPGKFIEFPPRDKENRCTLDPAWGINPQMTNDCGSITGSYLKKGLWAGFPNKFPCANELIMAISFSKQMIETAAAFVDAEDLSHDDAAETWLSMYKEVAQNWMPSCSRQ
ncbi:glycine/betaine ABC transporter substrate-binding protein [Chromatiales bacterium (ex Bugula neritina AB1)]|nr:glycine/betaine ABC transporter substrate-binding protein [Chromatiales bacterium (ex Bugula neritina AB1)]